MDSVPDKEIESIWNRVKQYVDPSQLKSKDADALASELDSLLEQSGKKKGKGDIQRLIDKGFSRRVVHIEGLRSGIELGKEKPVIKTKVRTKRTTVEKFRGLPNNVHLRAKGEKVAIRMSDGRTRVLNKDRVLITESTFKGMKAYYVYSTTLKKRISWGVIK